jgi:hypothetical protein
MRSLLLVLSAVSCFAADLPSADSLLKKSMAAMGGEAALARVKGSVLSGTVEMAGGSLTGPVVMYGSGGKQYVAIELPGVGKIEEGFDGETAWEMSALQGVRIKDGAERELAVRGAKMSPLSDWQEFYTDAKTVGEEPVDGKPAWKIVMTPKTSEAKTAKPETFYLDKESLLLVRTTMTMTMALGEIDVDESIGDYRPVNGIQTPFRMVQKAMNQVLTMKFDKASYDAEIPAGRFDLPPAVKTMVERRKAAPVSK